MDSYFFQLDTCDFSVLLTVSIFIFAMGGVMASFTILCFVLVSLIPSLIFFSLVVTNDFLEDMISVLDLFYPIYYKIKAILPAISISIHPGPQHSTTLNKIPVIQNVSLKYFYYHTNLIKLAAVGLLRQSNKDGATEYNNRNFARGSPTELFLYLISFIN